MEKSEQRPPVRVRVRQFESAFYLHRDKITHFPSTSVGSVSRECRENSVVSVSQSILHGIINKSSVPC